MNTTGLRRLAPARACGFGLAMALLWPAPSAAHLSDAARGEVDHMLLRIFQSGCEFYRAGSWYSAADARSHLERKLRFLVSGNMLNSAEDFIAKAATSSSMTNEPYAIRCPGKGAMPSAAWLEGELRTLRLAPRPSTPR